MNSLVKVFSNFKEFYNEINGATLTGAIDVIVVEQPDGEFQCSPFHVRFGKLGVLRSREKVVDIEINGEPVDIHMKLGDSGEAFFVEECPEEELTENLATSPIPSGFYSHSFDNGITNDKKTENINASDVLSLPLPLPRRNSIDFSKETPKDDSVPNFENQVSDYSQRRHTDNVLERRNLSVKLKEYTTQKLRQEWAEHEEIFNFDLAEKEKDWSNSTQAEEVNAENKDITSTPAAGDALEQTTVISVKKPVTEVTVDPIATAPATKNDIIENGNLNLNQNSVKDDQKAKKKRRKKSQMKKKNAQRKTSSSSSLGSNAPQETASATSLINEGDADSVSISMSNHSNLSNKSNSSSNDEAPLKNQDNVNNTIVDNISDTILAEVENGASLESGPKASITSITPTARIPDLDIHFFSDTEITSSGNNAGNSVRGIGRPSTPIQSDSELEISLREKDADVVLMSNTASWKWGELPTPELIEQKDGGSGQTAQAAQAQRNSMLSGMFNFMKKTNKILKQANEGGVYLSDLDAEGMDPEMLALYFPSAPLNKENTSTLNSAVGIVGGVDDDRESGNGTSLPHSPSSMEGQKSLDSDYEDGKQQDGKYLDFVAMSLSGMNEKNEVSDEDFERAIIKYSDVCNNPSLFSSPNLVVRLNGKYYSWAAACPIVMTIITFQKPLTNRAIEQITLNSKVDATIAGKNELDGNAAIAANVVAQSKRSWWYWRRAQNPNESNDGDQAAVATQTSRASSPDISDNTLTKTDSTLNAENTSAILENLEDLSQNSSKGEFLINTRNQNNQSLDLSDGKNERYKKSLRLSSEAIKKLNLKDGVNEIEFSVTTAYQGTTRCKCYLFRWKHNDKVVISDIDGTITRSDVLGHILPMVGKDWAQIGVAQLFSKIEQNGYKLLYLSARAIGQSRATREYLRSIRQGDVKLPDGPLLLNPTSLISAFHREVIERKPEQFKIACLSDIRDLFPDKDPFYAGYGNRINDVWAYRAVGIPIMRIFTINTKGELKHELTQTFQSSGYISQSLEVDEHFPFIELDDYDYNTDEFNDDEEMDELKFNDHQSSDDTTDTDNEQNDSDNNAYSDDNADDGIVVDEAEILYVKVRP